MEDKFQLTQKENVFLAKRNIVDYIWKSANLEGINITFPETNAIYEKLKVKEVDIAEVNTILNLKHAWKEVLGTIDDELNLEYICKIHKEVAKDEALTWGKLRTGTLGIAGINYIPPIPKKEEVIENLKIIDKIKPNTLRCIKLMLYLMKSQLFWDGNKRTAMLIANKELIKRGNGIISVPIEEIVEFNRLLSEYYSFGKEEDLISFIYDKALFGIEF